MSEEQADATFSNLSPDILLYIISYLDYRSIVHAMCVSKVFLEAASSALVSTGLVESASNKLKLSVNELVLLISSSSENLSSLRLYNMTVFNPKNANLNNQLLGTIAKAIKRAERHFTELFLNCEGISAYSIKYYLGSVLPVIKSLGLKKLNVSKRYELLDVLTMCTGLEELTLEDITPIRNIINMVSETPSKQDKQFCEILAQLKVLKLTNVGDELIYDMDKSTLTSEDAVTRTVFDLCPNLKRLEIQSKPITVIVTESLLKTLQSKGRDLEVLNVSIPSLAMRSSQDSKAITERAKGISSTTPYSSYSMAVTEIPSSTFIPLPGDKILQNVRELSLRITTFVSPEMLQSLQFPNLEVLKITPPTSPHGFYDRLMQTNLANVSVLEITAENNQHQHINFSILKEMTLNTKLTKVSFSAIKGLDIAGIQNLVTVCPNLQEMKMVRVDFAVTALPALSYEECTSSLRRVEMLECSIPSDILSIIFNVSGKTLNYLSLKKSAIVGSSTITAGIGAPMTALRTLNLKQFNKLYSYGHQRLETSRLLQDLSNSGACNVVELNIADADISSASLIALNSFLSKCKSLRRFKANGVACNDATLQAITDNKCMIQELLMSDSNLTEKEMLKLNKECLSGITKLRIMGLKFENINSAVDFLSSFRALQYLSFNLRNTGVTNSIFEFLMKNPCLECVFISGRSKDVTKATFEQFMLSMNRLQMIAIDFNPFDDGSEVELLKTKIRQKGRSAPKMILPYIRTKAPPASSSTSIGGALLNYFFGTK